MKTWRLWNPQTRKCYEIVRGFGGKRRALKMLALFRENSQVGGWILCDGWTPVKA